MYARTSETKRGGHVPPLDCPVRLPGSMAGGVHSARAPHIDAGEQEQPHHVDEVPVPGAELKAEMLRGREVSEIGADEAHDQEGRANDDVRAMEAGRHEEGRAVDVAGVVEAGVQALVARPPGEGE